MTMKNVVVVGIVVAICYVVNIIVDNIIKHKIETEHRKKEAMLHFENMQHYHQEFFPK